MRLLSGPPARGRLHPPDGAPWTPGRPTPSGRARRRPPILGWNVGDGHPHDDQPIQAIQRRLPFAPGELVVLRMESQPLHRPVQEYFLNDEYFVMDAALGIVERGRRDVRDLVDQQPWLLNGPVPLQVTWRHPQHHPAHRTAGGEEVLA